MKKDRVSSTPKNKQVEMPKGYKFVAAATMFKKFAGLGVYVKFKKSKESSIYVKNASKDHVHYICPDREVVLTVQDFNSASFRPDGFDKYLNLNMLQDEVAKGLDIDYVMTNYEHDREVYHRRDRKNPQIQVLSDSGGLQLVRGVTDYINPLDLIDYYNKNVDAGMSLDVPVWFDGGKIAHRAAMVQKRNNEIMLEKALPGVELINIIQGSTVEDRKRHRDLVHDDRITRCALGGFNYIHPLTGVNLVYEMMDAFKYKQYHILGVFSIPYISLFVKMANTGEKPHITSDATSHIQEAMASGYFYRANEANIMVRMPLGILGGSMQNSAMSLACSCAICSTIKYRDIMAFGHSRFFAFLAAHNAGKITEYANTLEYACKNLTPSQYNKYVMDQLRKNKDAKELRMALDFIDVAADSGLKKAQAKYKNWIHKWKTIGSTAPNMFEQATEEKKTAHKTQQILKVLDIYEGKHKPKKGK
jgi:hypothetical protein